MAVTGNTQLAPTKQEVISALVQRQLISSAIVAPTVRDVSVFAQGKGKDRISFPKKGNFTVENRASATAATIQDLSFTKDTMDLNFRATIAWTIDSHDEIESSVDVELEYARAAAAGHAVYVDNQIIAEMETVAVPTTTAGSISDAVILEMRAALLRRKADPRKLWLAVSPEDEADLLNINKFISADYNAGSVVPNGALGRIYGANVVMTPELAAGQYFMYDSDAIALGFQRLPQIGERQAPEYGVGSMLKVMDQKFGVKGLQIGQAGVGATLSALIVKDANA